MKFETKAKLGYAVLSLLLVAGMAFSVRRLSDIADAELGRVTSAHNEIVLVERLRWNGEVMVSSGRGYLLSGDPTLLERLEVARGRFQANLAALRGQPLDRESDELVSYVEQNAAAFTDLQEELLDARRRSESSAALVRRFDARLLPLSRQLDDTLARLVRHEEIGVATVYELAHSQRERFEAWLDVLFVALLVLAFGVAWYFSTLLGRSYRQERAAHQAAQAAVAARDELMAIVAHDLRNPLGAITMRAAMLKDATETEKARQQAESIENIAVRMGYQIRTMLDVATIEAGRFSVLPSRCEVDEIARETIDLFAPLASAKRITLHQQVATPHLAIHADRERIAQVLSNLLGNALKFTPPGGNITLSFDVEDAAGRFGVADTGPGIPRENQPRLFERFWKDETSGTRGTGLGLFIAKGIVEAHSGRIWVDSEPGKGACFYFTVPLEPEPRLPTAKTEPA